MRRNLLASTALTTSTSLLTGAALAADLPLKAPPPVAPIPFSWTGCYVGVNAGGASTRIDHNLTVPSFGTLDSGGREGSFIGGGQVGCNWQFDPKWVLGLEGDFDWLKATRNHNFAFGVPDEDTVAALGTSLRSLGTVRVKFGYAWDRSLLYATGGLAIGRVTASTNGIVDPTDPHAGIYTGSYAATRTGWVGGGGYAYAFTDRVFATLEYMHFDLGTAGYNVVRVAGTAGDSTVWFASTKVNGDIVRVGIDWKFYP